MPVVDGCALEIGGALIGIPDKITTPRGKLFWRDGGVRMSGDGTGIAAEAISAHFDAGKFRVRWKVPGLPQPLVTFEPEPVSTGPGHIVVNPEKFLLFAE